MNKLKQVMNNTNPPVAVTVYDVEDKKAVIICYSMTKLAKFLGERNTGLSMLHNVAFIRSAIERKSTYVNTYFNRTICFRYSTITQQKILGEAPILVLDNRYK